LTCLLLCVRGFPFSDSISLLEGWSSVFCIVAFVSREIGWSTIRRWEEKLLAGLISTAAKNGSGATIQIYIFPSAEIFFIDKCRW
jgi:hypothetical protein